MSPEPPQNARGFRFWVLVLITIYSSSVNAAPSAQTWQPTPARPYVLRGSGRRLLDRAERYLADEQWEDAIAALRHLLDIENFSVVAVDEHLFVSLPEYCHRLLAQLPADALSRYRELVDATAESWYRQGVELRDRALLQRVVEKAFCSSWGDDALLALGELDLEEGNYQAARMAWQRIVLQKTQEVAPAKLVYPDTDLSRAVVQSRLILLAIRTGDWQRAEVELARFAKDTPDVRGRLGGREVVLANALAGLLEQARRWEAIPEASDWGTFGANAGRSFSPVLQKSNDDYELVWSVPLANDRGTIFPVVVDDLVVCRVANAVCALNLIDGQERFFANGAMFQTSDQSSQRMGRNYYTLTATDRHVFGVTTMPTGVRHNRASNSRASSFWSLDLQRDGAVSLHQSSEDPAVVFVGAPVVEAGRLYVSIRSHGQTARAGIACYDRYTGEQIWQRWLCQANMPTTGQAGGLVASLLTYNSGIVYANTNLGAVAAVRAEDGRVLWLRRYQRQRPSQLKADAGLDYRGPNPCVYQFGRVFALPADGNVLLAIDATTGKRLWEHLTTAPDARIVCVTDESLVLADGELKSLDPVTGETNRSVDAEDVAAMYSSIRKLVPDFDSANVVVTGDRIVVAGRTQLAVLQSSTIQSSTPTTDSLQESQTSSREKRSRE